MKILKKLWKNVIVIKFFKPSINNICNFAFIRGFREE